LVAQNRIAEIKVKAERKTGELLKEMEKQKPGEYQRFHDGTVAPSLKDLGIEKTQSMRWQHETTNNNCFFHVFASFQCGGLQIN
jgi:hypothetical protein